MPAAEVDLCGHTKLAASHWIFLKLNLSLTEIFFETTSGVSNSSPEAVLIKFNFLVKSGRTIELPSGSEAADGYSP